MIAGRATPEGTARFAARHPAAHASHWRSGLGVTLSSLGIGTYLGGADPATDASYAAAVRRAFERGVNVVDSAINYRYQRSERSIGTALKGAIDAGIVARDEILLCTKGGFIAGDGGPPTAAWFQKAFAGVASPDDIVADCHCMTPAYLRHEVDQSRRNLGVETIDAYYVHNAETQIPEVGEDEYATRLTAAFRELENLADEGKIGVYGTATWNEHRSPEADPSSTPLKRVLDCAKQAGGAKHRFRVLQLPFNLGMTEGRAAIGAAAAAGLAVFTSVPLLQGQLLNRIPPAMKAGFGSLATDAQRCLQFARSTPGVVAPLCGMKNTIHVDENTGIAGVPALDGTTARSLTE